MPLVVLFFWFCFIWAAVAHCCTLSAENKALNILSSVGQKPKMGLMGLKSRCLQAVFLSGAPGENPSPCLL